MLYVLTSIENHCIDGTAATKALPANQMASAVIETRLWCAQELPVYKTVGSSETLSACQSPFSRKWLAWNHTSNRPAAASASYPIQQSISITQAKTP